MTSVLFPLIRLLGVHSRVPSRCPAAPDREEPGGFGIGGPDSRSGSAAVLLALVALLAWGCGDGGRSGDDAGAGPPDGILQLHERDLEASRSRDLEALVSLWTEDGVILPPGQEAVRGRPAIREWIRNNLASSSHLELVRYEQDFEEIEVTGGHAFEWGRFRGAYATAAGDTLASAGRLMRVLRRGPDGTWRVARAIWQESVPDTMPDK